MNSRNKGHQYERVLAKFFRDVLGFVYCKTSRAASKLLDDCGVDLAFLPVLVQAKRGYNKNRPKFDNIFNKIKSSLSENYPKDDPIHDKPIILAHKLDGRGKQYHQITMCYEDLETLIQLLKNQIGIDKEELRDLLECTMREINDLTETLSNTTQDKTQHYSESYDRIYNYLKTL